MVSVKIGRKEVQLTDSFELRQRSLWIYHDDITFVLYAEVDDEDLLNEIYS